MFSEIMFAFTEVAEMKTKNSEKCTLFSTEMLSRCVINLRQNRELEKHQEKTTSFVEKVKVEVELYSALVLNITY